MRFINSSFAAVALVALCAVIVTASHALAQQSQSGSQDQSKNGAPAKPPAPPASDDNAFPEDASRKAAKDAQAAKSANGQTPSPDSSSQDSTKPAAKPGADENAFPEDVSRKAAANAKAAASGSSGNTGSSASSSSSGDYEDRSNGSHDALEPNANMRHLRSKDLAREDLYVGGFYLQSGDYVGAYARFKEASTLHPENTDAMFGLAEAARHLNKKDEAMENYRLYLDVVPSGAKAKEARKALASLEKPH